MRYHEALREAARRGPGYRVRRDRRRKHGWYIRTPVPRITKREKLAMLREQNYRCLICRCKLTMKTAVADHDHKTGRIRSLTCRADNLLEALVGRRWTMRRVARILALRAGADGVWIEGFQLQVRPRRRAA
jgi:hypothetical protein